MFDSPFKQDQKFALGYVAQMSRDKMEERDDVISSVFYDRIFNILLRPDYATN